MKKYVILLLFILFSTVSFSQKGTISVGAKGGLVYTQDYFKDLGVKYLYGLNIDYNLTDALEASLSGLMNTNAEKYSGDALSVYSTNLDFRLYLLQMRTWATGPALGGQYIYAKNKVHNDTELSCLGFNLGWHFKVFITDNLGANVGWRYTNAKEKANERSFPMNHHLFYAGLTYSFNLF